MGPADERRRGGFSLIEAFVAMLVMASASFMYSTTFSVNREQIQEAKARAADQEIASQLLDQITSAPRELFEETGHTLGGGTDPGNPVAYRRGYPLVTLGESLNTGNAQVLMRYGKLPDGTIENDVPEPFFLTDEQKQFLEDSELRVRVLGAMVADTSSTRVRQFQVQVFRDEPPSGTSSAPVSARYVLTGLDAID